VNLKSLKTVAKSLGGTGRFPPKGNRGGPLEVDPCGATIDRPWCGLGVSHKVIKREGGEAEVADTGFESLANGGT